MKLVEWFIQEYPTLVEQMRNCSYHHESSINKHHLEGDVWSHTLLSLTYTHTNNISETIQWALLLHDIGRLYTRNINKENNRLSFGDFEGVSCYTSLEVLNQSPLNQDQKIEVLKIISYHYTMIDHMKFNDPRLEELQRQFKAEELLLKSLAVYALCDLKGRIISHSRKHLYDFEAMKQTIQTIEQLPTTKHTPNNNRPTLYLLIGPPCAGKSSWIKQQNFDKDTLIINRDSCTMKIGSLYGKYTYDEAYDLMQEDPEVKKKVNMLDESKEAIAKETTTANVVIDNPNLKRKNRKEWIDELQTTHTIKAIVFLTPFNILRQRNEKRKTEENKSISSKGLVRKLKTFTFPLLSEGFDSIEIVSV